MATLKELKTRISSVQSTRKITSAMKMIAAARLKQSQRSVEASRPYAQSMYAIMAELARKAKDMENPPLLLSGKAEVKTVLLIAVTSDRGLCGGFNSNIARAVRLKVHALRAEKKEVKILCIGNKAKQQLRSEFKHLFLEPIEEISAAEPSPVAVEKLLQQLTHDFEHDVFDEAIVIFNRFINAITQEVEALPFIPAKLEQMEEDAQDIYKEVELEPSEEKFIKNFLPKSLANSLYSTLLESFAAEQAARMTAMDNATRNAGDMIKDLTLQANRQRQAQITTELTEIISGAEAL